MRFTFLLLSVGIGLAQPAQDSITEAIPEIVVTGQFEPQSVKKSVFNVRVISSKDIKQLAANNLSDVLNQYLNINIRPDSQTGRSTVSLLGLDGQYFKVLMDNVPMVSDNGLGNNIDLTQINLDQVERIEIIEGSMGVTHGANAVSGILNIITKKNATNRWEISATLQEETVGNEYSWFKRGRHIQGIQLSHKLNDNWFISAGANRNNFTGFRGEYRGEDHAVNDLRRGYSQLPKEQLNTQAAVRYSKDDFRLFYRFEFLTETIDFYNRTVSFEPNPPFGDLIFANDERYLTNRFYQHLNATGSLGRIGYNVSVSHQKQERDQEDFRYNLTSHNESNNNRYTDQSSEIFYSTGTFSKFFKSEVFDLQLGYEAVNNKGFSVVEGQNQNAKEVSANIGNIDFFASAEYKFTSDFSVRPGFRYSFQDRFDNQYAASLSLRQLFKRGFEARATLGRSYRTPNFEELYMEFIIPSHYYIGNANLIPETGISYEVNLRKNSAWKDFNLTNSFTASFVDIADKIYMALLELGPPRKYQYININEYRVYNFSTTNQLRYKELSISAGASLIGISQVIDSGEAKSDDAYLPTFNFNASVSYEVKKWQSVFAAYYKYNGKQREFVESSDENMRPVYKTSVISPFSWIDASVTKTFFDKRLEASLGARNVLDITDVRRSMPNAGTAHPSNGSVLLGYGRSYFLKLKYNLYF
jgi:outer membrane receptor for ferrienterochelin and colicins